jgi:hypothetical protein
MFVTRDQMVFATYSRDFPMKSSFSTDVRICDAFLAKLPPAGGSLVFSTVWGEASSTAVSA